MHLNGSIIDLSENIACSCLVLLYCSFRVLSIYRSWNSSGTIAKQSWMLLSCFSLQFRVDHPAVNKQTDILQKGFNWVHLGSSTGTVYWIIWGSSFGILFNLRWYSQKHHVHSNIMDYECHLQQRCNTTVIFMLLILR